MKKRAVPILVLLSICLILMSLSLLAIFQIRMHLGAQQCKNIVSLMDQILPDRTAGIPGMNPASCMPVLEIEGTDYVALLEIPSFGITLPVADKWQSNKLPGSPARFYGSAYDNTLIIGGADDSRQFGFCDKIELGALVTVTDMTGARFSYAVSSVERAKHAKTQWLADADCDLTLFCYDIYSMEYIAVRFVLTGNE